LPLQPFRYPPYVRPNASGNFHVNDPLSCARIKAIDLFAGAGGLSLGLKNAGWEVVAAMEVDKYAVATHHANFPGTKSMRCDVRDVDWSKFRGIDLMAGGPPCQPFSVSGKQLGHADRRDMVPEFIRIVSQVRPAAFIMENVKGLALAKFKEYLDSAINALKALCYNVNHTVLNAADHGVPQFRERLFIVGSLEGEFVFPEPTHGPGRTHPWRTVADAISDAPVDAPNTAKVVYCKNPILRKSPNAGMLVNGKGRPLNMAMPSLTIPASAGGNRTHIIDRDEVLLEYHAFLMNGGSSRTGIVEGCRRLTLRECARIQGFPDSFGFLGPKSNQFSQVGNAVPPLLAEVICRSVRKQLENQMLQVA
jgi:DNA (cytosine-5)-methyltransferase 1